MRDPLLVVELAQGIAGPTAGRLFSALGHTVVKVEGPDGDRLRRAGDGRDDIAWAAATFAHVNAGKLSVIADDELRRRLVDRADIVLIDEHLDEARRLEVLGAGRGHRYPRLVTASVSSFGLDGHAPGIRPDSLLGESHGGMATMIGDADRPPLSLGGEQAEYAAGITAFFGAMAAAVAADRTGRGEVVDVAVSDVVAYMDWKSDIAYEVTGVVPSRLGAASGRWRIVPARDGWVGIVYQPDQWDRMVALIDDPRLADPALREEASRDESAGQWWPAVEQWAASRTRREVYDQGQALGLAFGMSVDMHDVLESAQNRARGFIREGELDPLGALFRSPELGWRTGPVPRLDGDRAAVEDLLAAPAPVRDAAQGDPVAGPLAGMRVLDLGTITAGAATGRLLADLGAEVLKIESPTRPDAFRYWSFPGETGDGAAAGTSPVFESNNSGKVGIALDLKDAEQRAALLELVRDAHVLIENFSVGVTARLGIDPATVHAANPDLVYLSLSSQGQDGPEAGYRSYGSTLDLLSGLASITGYPGGAPTWSSVDVNYPDQLVSLLGAGVVCAAWWRGGGATIDVAQREAVTWTLAGYVGAFTVTGEVPGPRGNARPGYRLHEVVRSADGGWLAVSVADAAEESALDAHLPRGAGDLAGRLAAWAARQERDAAVAALRGAGVPAAAVLDAAERRRIPHFGRRRVFLDGPRRKGFPFVFEDRALPEPGPAPRVGEHNRLLARLSPTTTGG